MKRSYSPPTEGLSRGGVSNFDQRQIYKRAKRTVALHWQTERLDDSTVGGAKDVAQLK